MTPCAQPPLPRSLSPFRPRPPPPRTPRGSSYAGPVQTVSPWRGSSAFPGGFWGYHNGLPVGSWSLEQRTTDTSWTLFFDTDAVAFPMGGHFLEQSYQEWNASGQVNDCGVPGFGFNGGNWAQDFCIDNVWIEESSIDPDTPLPAVAMDEALRCDTVVPLS